MLLCYKLQSHNMLESRLQCRWSNVRYCYVRRQHQVQKKYLWHNRYGIVQFHAVLSHSLMLCLLSNPMIDCTTSFVYEVNMHVMCPLLCMYLSYLFSVIVTQKFHAVCIRMHEYVCVWMDGWMDGCLRGCVYVYMYVCMNVLMYVITYVIMHALQVTKSIYLLASFLFHLFLVTS